MKQCSICNEFFEENDFNFKDKKTNRRSTFCKYCQQNKNKIDRKNNPEKYHEYQQRQYNKNRKNPIMVEKQRDANKRYYQTHKDIVLKRTKTYREQHWEQYLEYQKLWVKNNPEKVKARVKRFKNTKKFKDWEKEYREKNIIKIRETQRNSKRKWRANFPEKARQYDIEYRQRENAKLTDRVCSERKRSVKKNADGRFTAQDIKNIFSNQNGLCYWCDKSIENEYHIDHYIPLSKGGTNFPDNIVLSCPQCNIRRNNKMPDESKLYLKENWL